MARSLKKGPYVYYKLLKKLEKAKASNKKTVIKTWSRSSMVIPDMVGETIAVHNEDLCTCICYRKHGRPQAGRVRSYAYLQGAYRKQKIINC
jgi:hypothetical protein